MEQSVTRKNGHLFILRNPDASGDSKSDTLSHLGKAKGVVDRGLRYSVVGALPECGRMIAMLMAGVARGGLLRRRCGWDWEREKERWVRWMEVLGRLV